ncbi:MAG: hypothetical protein IPH17_03830 [Bacteroidales bacterium]|nr:hypothetical protein [Bacteroidales bacterium]
MTVNPTTSTTYTVTGTTLEGCTGTAEVTVTVHPLPTITATATPSRNLPWSKCRTHSKF